MKIDFGLSLARRIYSVNPKKSALWKINKLPATLWSHNSFFTRVIIEQSYICKQTSLQATMSTTSNMSMTSSSTNNSALTVKTANGMNRFNLSRPARAATSAKNPMRRFAAQKPQGSLIDEALDILNSPGSTASSVRSAVGRRGSMMGRRGALQRRGSALCERRASELLMDNGDRLSTLVLSGIDIDFDSDDDSDLDC